MLRLILLILLTAAPLLAQKPAPTRPAPETILAQERLFWDHYTAGDTEALAQQLAPEFQNVEQEIWNREQVLKFVHAFFSGAHCGLAPVKIEDPRITVLDAATATIVYHATESVICQGKTMGGDTNVTTLWRLVPGGQGGAARWQMQLHTEYAVPPDFKPSGF